MALAQKGFSIAIVDIASHDDPDAQSTMKHLDAAGASYMYLCSDISEIASHQTIVDKVTERFGRIDCLVNNAGVQAVAGAGGLLEIDVEDFDHVMSINLRGTFFFSQCVMRAMLSSDCAGLTSRMPRTVVTISSANAVLARSDRPAYCLSKAALSMLNRMIAVRLAPFGILAYEVRPGLIKTDLNRAIWDTYSARIEAGLTPIARWGTTADVGNTVAALACGALPFTTGAVVDVDGGLMLPRSPFEQQPSRTLAEA
jgi:NAD(P)-dependent dehydrogenase (short-subunit alcohol dehydrogenase family)